MVYGHRRATSGFIPPLGGGWSMVIAGPPLDLKNHWGDWSMVIAGPQLDSWKWPGDDHESTTSVFKFSIGYYDIDCI